MQYICPLIYEDLEAKTGHIFGESLDRTTFSIKSPATIRAKC